MTLDILRLSVTKDLLRAMAKEERALFLALGRAGGDLVKQRLPVGAGGSAGRVLRCGGQGLGRVDFHKRFCKKRGPGPAGV